MLPPNFRSLATLLAALLALSFTVASVSAQTDEDGEPTAPVSETESAEGEPAEGETSETDSETEPEGPAGVSGGVTEAAPEDAPRAATRETQCADHTDDDGDGLMDCADADCYGDEACAFGGESEANDERCHDWVDNDGDGEIDCADAECQGPGITVCAGSDETHQASGDEDADMELPMTGDMTVEDLLASDPSGENNDYTCSDGLDNDNDGRIDCADLGCRFDPQVTVCTQSPGFRFSVVAGVFAEADVTGLVDDSIAGAPQEVGERLDVNFSRLQVRALGPTPFINTSFFLLSARLEKSPRLTFAHFQVPIGSRGHYFALNSGSGGLSTGLIISTAKQALLAPPFYLFNEFEQGNGASFEVGGPVVESGMINYRVFAAGGSGVFNGNVGGRFFRDDETNFTYTVGAQFQFNFLGHFNRFDSRFIYTRQPLALGFVIGGKWDQRATQQYPAANAKLVFRYSF